MITIAPILEGHAENAPFLWLQRDHAVRAPHYSLKDLAKLDDRIEAHVDGLRVASDAGWELALEGLARAEAGAYFVAMVLALESGRKERIAAMVDRAAGDASRRGVTSALAWVDWEVAKPIVGGLLTEPDPHRRQIAIAACAITRQNPGRHLGLALGETNPALRARACRAVGELGRKDLLGEMAPLLAAEDDRVRFWAAWSASLLVDARGFGPLWKFVGVGAGWRTAGALAVSLRALPPAQAQDWLRMLGRDPARRRAAITGVGTFGDPAYIPWLIRQMNEPPAARLSGEAFSMITGADLDSADLRGQKPEGFEMGPTDDAADPNVDLDPDEKLPWPDPGKIAAWWGKNAGGYTPGTRYLLGKPITPESLADVLRNGRQRQRAAAALEFAIRGGGMLFETRARGDKQQLLLKVK